jgi:PTS system mannose-specific IIB component/fructoselysine and glucoselysine-specific PTS system IIB component
MSILLFRVDERLIHGQVVVGWGSTLRPDRFVVVDEALAESDWEQELYLLGVPEGAEALFLTPQEAAQHLPEWESSPLGFILLTRDVSNMLALAQGGGMAGRAVNLGGIHFQTGRDQVLPYIFLDDEDRARIRSLSEKGITVAARDLPGSSEVGLETLLA